MGTRADFYVGRGKDAEWIGSIAWDGYPGGITPKDKPWRVGGHLFQSKTAATFRKRLAAFFDGREDVTMPDHGWPWPWENSHTTDYSYAFDGGRVYASCYGHRWFNPMRREPQEHGDDKPTVFPDMTNRQRVTLGKRSGVIMVSANGPVDAE